MTGHVWDFGTQYCLRCGQSREHAIMERLSKCIPEGSNVIAISHIICRKKLQKLTRLSPPTKDPA